jgi:hypothetical protein
MPAPNSVLCARLFVAPGSNKLDRWLRGLRVRCVEVHTFEVARKEGDGVARVASPLDAHNLAREFARVPKRSSHSPFFQLPGIWRPIR